MPYSTVNGRSDLLRRLTTRPTDEQRYATRLLLPQPSPAKYLCREIMNAVLYQAPSGAVGPGLPHDLPRTASCLHLHLLSQLATG
jgi:hypothetical protein